MATNRKAFQASKRLDAARANLRKVLKEYAERTDVAMTELRQAEIALRLAVDDNANWK